MPGADDLLLQLTDDGALEAFLAAWRAGTLPKPAWTHAAHVAVCAAEAWPAVPLEALAARMKAGILAYNTAVGTANTTTSGYHETLTWFWCERVLAHQAAHPEPDRLAAVRSAVAAYGEARNLHAGFYDFDVVRDPGARAVRVPPRGVTNQDN